MTAAMRFPHPAKPDGGSHRAEEKRAPNRSGAES